MAFIVPVLAAIGGGSAWAGGALVVSAAAAGVSAYGMIQQGKAQGRQADYSAKMQDNEAISEGYAAISDAQNANREAAQKREMMLRNLSSQQTAAAKSGLTISGSVLDVMSDTAISSEKDIALTIYGGNVAGYNHANAAAGDRASANLTRSAGRSAITSSYYSAAGTLIGGLSSAAGKYASFKSR